MVAARAVRWQAGPVEILARGAVLLALVAIGAGAAVAPAGAGPRGPILAQTRTPAPAAPPAGARVVTFTWTLYPGMWAELDLGLDAGAEAVAEITVEGGAVRWNLHAHPPDAPPTAFAVLAEGAGARATVRCAPEAPGLYSYLFGHDGSGGPVRLRVELGLTGDARLVAVKP
jgi:hypothetical protein